MKATLTLDFEIEEGGRYPDAVFRRCDRDDHVSDYDKCSCGFRCPKCGIVKAVHRQSLGQIAGVEVARLVCLRCDTVIAQFGTHPGSIDGLVPGNPS